MKHVCGVYLEDRKRGTVLVLRIGSGEDQGLWTVPGGMIDEDEDPREQAEEIAKKQIGTDVELFPFEEELEYPDRKKYIFKGRLEEPTELLDNIYSERKDVSYDELLNLDLKGSTEADLKRLEGDFFRVYEE